MWVSFVLPMDVTRPVINENRQDGRCLVTAPTAVPGSVPFLMNLLDLVILFHPRPANHREAVAA
jgi:hypothetical protein